MNEREECEEFEKSGIPGLCVDAGEEMLAWTAWLTRAALAAPVQQEPQSDHAEALALSIENFLGCFDMAIGEGLLEAVQDTPDERMKDLLERRILTYSTLPAEEALRAYRSKEPSRTFTYKACLGMNCGCTDGKSHSLECEAEHAANVAGGKFVKPDHAEALADAVSKFFDESGKGEGIFSPAEMDMPIGQAYEYVYHSLAAYRASKKGGA